MPRQFSVVYMDGWGAIPLEQVARDLDNLGPGDVLLMNVGAHAVRLMTFEEWMEYTTRLAGLLANSSAAVVWRTTMPVADHLYRNAEGTTFFSDGHFQVSAWTSGAWRGRQAQEAGFGAQLQEAAVQHGGRCPTPPGPGGRKRRRPDSADSSRSALLQTEARRILFDSYAEHAMRRGGVAVWDITAFGPAGSHRLADMFHLDGKTMRDLNLDMAERVLC